MAVTSGTATSYRDLLGKIRDFVLAQPGWSQVGGQAGAIAADTDFVSLRGTGLAGEDEFFVSLGMYATPASNIFGLRLRGHTAYAAPGTSQPGGDSPWTYLPTLNSPVGYWIICNGRRFIVIVKTSARYDAMYAGFMLPEHLPADWAYPLMVGASSPLPIGASSDEASHSNFWNAINSANSVDNAVPSACQLFSPIRSWVPIRNGRTQTNVQFFVDTGRMTLPWSRVKNQNVRQLLDDAPYVVRGQVAGFYRDSSGNLDANMPERGVFYGGLDGVFYAAAFGSAAEQELVIDAKTYMLVPNISRNTDGQFAAILME